MDSPRFDPEGYFEFDLATGAVRTRTGTRVTLLSDGALEPLVAAAVQLGDLTALRKLGNQFGAEISESLAHNVSQSAADLVMGRAAAMVSMFGWGRLQLERWGDALVATLDSSPTLDTERLALAALLGGLFSSLSGREVATVPVGYHSRFLMVEPRIAEQVWTWTREGAELPDILKRLKVPDVI